MTARYFLKTCHLTHIKVYMFNEYESFDDRPAFGRNSTILPTV